MGLWQVVKLLWKGLRGESTRRDALLVALGLWAPVISGREEAGGRWDSRDVCWTWSFQGRVGSELPRLREA